MATLTRDDSTSKLQSGMHHIASVTNVADFVQTEAARNVAPPSPFKEWQNAASKADGARVLFATDEWFASADRLIEDSSPVFDPDAYCVQGKVMDGWESRRRREAGHDWNIIQLSRRTNLIGVEIDTAHFTGNQVPQISLQVADLTAAQAVKMVSGFPTEITLTRLLFGGVQGTGASPDQIGQAEKACQEVEWKELLPRTPLRPGYEPSRMHYFRIPTDDIVGTHVRVNYYPDGGVARLRLWGTYTKETPDKPIPQPAYCPIRTGRTCSVIPHGDCVGNESQLPSRQTQGLVEVSSEVQGGIGVTCSNKHYGEPWHLIQKTLGRDMGDGWETARNPERPSVLIKDPTTNLVASSLNDWAVLKLGHPTNAVDRIILDTKHFRGNYPESVLLEGCYVENDDFLLSGDDSVVEWFTLVPRGRMAPDAEHVYETSKNQVLNADRLISHVRLSIFPDGGVSRVRVYAKEDEKQ
uniref:Allantoicase domain-containing protein n=1 Tax=Amphora coffeiformis TaxID=265554 RepID=A0A7S3LGT8_9STRA